MTNNLIQEAVDAAKALLEDQGFNFAEWRDIETAPKDGTEILLSDESFVFSGEYDLRYGRFGRFTHEGLEEYQHPTHWTPLPEAPKE